MKNATIQKGGAGMMKCRNCRNNVIHEEYGEEYSWCVEKADNYDIGEERDCSFFHPATNAQIIRAMSLDDMVKWLEERGAIPPNCDKESISIDYKKCRDCWVNWLKQEATD